MPESGAAMEECNDVEKEDSVTSPPPYIALLDEMKRSLRRKRSIRQFRQALKKAKMFLQRRLVRKLKNEHEHLRNAQKRVEAGDGDSDASKIRVTKMTNRIDKIQLQLQLAKVWSLRIVIVSS
jgi:hypothetical protein